MFNALVAGEINPDLILKGNVEPEFGQIMKLVDSARLTIDSSSATFACGALSTQKAGGTDAQSTLDETIKYVS